MSEPTRNTLEQRQKNAAEALRLRMSINRSAKDVANDVPKDADHGLLLRARCGDKEARRRMSELFESREISRWKRCVA